MEDEFTYFEQEVIEERPRSSGGGTKQMLYLASDRKG